MPGTHHLIIGAGMAGHAAAAAIREVDSEASITMLGAELDAPYARPLLSKGLWLGRPEESVWLPEVPEIERRAGTRAVSIDLVRHEVRDAEGGVHPYDRLLLATGGTPRRLPGSGDRVMYFRTLADYRRLRAVAGRRVVVIGGGFIGTELAAALAQNGKEVTLVFPEVAVGARIYPADLAEHLTRTFREKGVRVLAGARAVMVAPVPGHPEATLVRTADGTELTADAVVAGLGVDPDLELAADAGIQCSDGIEVDERLETSVPGVFAAGDVARFPCPALGLTLRFEHEDAAMSMGATAGRNMAGAAEGYTHLPFFYSDLFDLGYEAVGLLDARLETVATWKQVFREGVVYYLDHGRVRGVLLWGIFGQVDAARALIAGGAGIAKDALGDAIRI